MVHVELEWTKRGTCEPGAGRGEKARVRTRSILNGPGESTRIDVELEWSRRRTYGPKARREGEHETMEVLTLLQAKVQVYKSTVF